MDVKGHRALARRNHREAGEVVQERPREEEIVESEEEILEYREPCSLRIRIPGARARSGPPAAAIPAPFDPGMWLSMVNVKPPHLADLEVESMKKFILDYKRYSQKCPRLLLRKMQQFILEEQLEVICDKDGREYEKIAELEKEEFIQVMLKQIPVVKGAVWLKIQKWRNQIYLSIPTCNMWRILSSGCWLLGMLIGSPRKRPHRFLSVVSSRIFFVKRFIRDRVKA
jgi:hypothetical protein